MLLTPLLTAGIETSLNYLLFRERGLKAARTRLVGKVLRIELQELNAPLTFVFSEQKIDVLGQWDGEADCTVTTKLSVLQKLRDRQQLSPLMRSGELIVEGDISVVQQFSALFELVEWEPAELLAPYLGDVAAQGISQAISGGLRFLRHGVKQQQSYVAQTLTEEWKLAPGPLEVVWFSEEVSALTRELDALDKRFEKLEDKL
ncbi:MAG: SCP2 domain-containing protein [Ewingella sp.]|uniref:ubiquinone biosynthesis protein UbiJ n=1 Tax=Ewingella allii TaxID=3092550 RepID=UPI00264BB5B0|nr:SCP2 domain-containing protein [Ewingella sp.]